MRIRRAHWVALDYVLAAVCALVIFTTLLMGVLLFVVGRPKAAASPS